MRAVWMIGTLAFGIFVVGCSSTDSTSTVIDDAGVGNDSSNNPDSSSPKDGAITERMPQSSMA